MSLHPHRWWWRTATMSAIGALVATLFTGGTLFGSGARSEADAGPRPCPAGETVPVLESPHISQAEAASVRYSSQPPTSGPHFPFSLAPGAYDRPIPDGLTLHALEQGQVALLYAPDTPVEVVAQMRRLVHANPRSLLLAPHPSVRGGVVLTAWGCLQRQPTYDAAAAADFVGEVIRRREPR
ncbi:DUF3105 domain-containing protein [Micromonospora profundi]|uniref:DUF3105 domain-containing protein n=1 Tax=Micromonospora profundi TaxID=1420889 RepID=UPI003699429E